MKPISNPKLKKARLIIFTCLAVLAFASAGWAAEYYVSASGGSDSNPGTLDRPWKTIGKANSTLRAGDTVFIRTGTYTGEQISPSGNGTASSRITYRNYNNEKPVIEQSGTPLVLNNRSYITVHGITIRNCDIYMSMSNGHYNHIEYCTIDAMRTYKRFAGFQVGPDASYNWIHHNTISRYGEYTSTADKGDMVYIGDPSSPGDTHHNLVEDNHIYYGGHNVFSLNGHHNVVRNNYFHNEEWKNGYGGRTSVIRGGKSGGLFNLIEGNRWCFTGLPPDSNAATGLKIHANDNIIRRNMFYRIKGAGVQLATLSPYLPPLVDNNYIFHNNFFVVGQGSETMAITFNNDVIKGTVIKNNIFSEVPGTLYAFKGQNSRSNATIESNWETGDPMFADAVPSKTTDPFNMTYPDFNLKANSPCIDAAAFLTTTAAAGSGTRIPVKDAHYFVDGFGIIEGDIIRLANQTQTAKITAVDYKTNTLTVDKSLTWSANQGVTLNYAGSAPDFGAFESGIDDSGTPGVALLPPENLRVVY